MPKKPGPLPKPIKLKGEGPSASEQLIQDRDAGLTQRGGHEGLPGRADSDLGRPLEEGRGGPKDRRMDAHQTSVLKALAAQYSLELSGRQE